MHATTSRKSGDPQSQRTVDARLGCWTLSARACLVLGVAVSSCHRLIREATPQDLMVGRLCTCLGTRLQRGRGEPTSPPVGRSPGVRGRSQAYAPGRARRFPSSARGAESGCCPDRRLSLRCRLLVVESSLSLGPPMTGRIRVDERDGPSEPCLAFPGCRGGIRQRWRVIQPGSHPAHARRARTPSPTTRTTGGALRGRA